ncbi:MAG: FRG domain-containing protein, partial [Bacteroidia bacterium]|nr:FRG domain-containing protein [Bacteroidia bacterium]
MKRYNEIKELIDVDFDKYLTELLTLNDNPRKYFYWSFDFFRIIGGLSFQYFILSDEQKIEINSAGLSYFDSEEIYFKINDKSHRHDLSVNNIARLFESSVLNQQKRSEYLKEFILWDILQKLKEKLSEEINELNGKFSDSEKDESEKKIDEINYITEIITKQKANYLFTYISYLLNNTKNPTFRPFANYIKYNLTKKGEDLIKKLDELDREYTYDSRSGKEIKQQIHNLNPELRKKIENLYVLKEEEPKLHFVFTRNQGGGKEELRELLDIMGKDETGNLYRGQADSSWSLDASITREPKYKESEGDMYYEILSLKPDAFQNDKTVYERLITMQHFGMPTRLMDVTRNPLVSIFFACNNLARKDSDGVIFTFKQEKKSDFLNFEDKKLRFLPILFNNG